MAGSRTSIAGAHCLVLDDEFLIALDIQQILEAAGAASAICVANAEDALATLHGERAFDLAVLDLKLGGSAHSLTVAAALAARGTPFIFLTGMSCDDALLRGFPDVPVVEKPYHASSLLEAVRRAFAT